MTTNTPQPNMGDKPKGLTVSDKDDDHYIFERNGMQCQVCGKIGHPHDLEEGLMLAYPLWDEIEPKNLIPVCGDCWRPRTEEQLDEYVREMKEHQRALDLNRGDYGQNRDRAFERDDHTCQLCGEMGVPKAERGLIAYPVCARNYHLENLVTICNECLTDALNSDEDDQIAADRLRIRAARAKKWINSAGRTSNGGEDEEAL